MAALAVLTAVAQPHLLASDTLVSVDTASQYYPWYAFLGKSLMAGRIPGWNPATFSGAPFAADPLSGWTYLPAMVLFGLLPLADAAKAYVVFHPLLAAWSTYALARAIGLSRVGAFVAALAYANTGFLQIQNLCCSPVASIYAWLPATLLAADNALHSQRMPVRAASWGLAGLGVSQVVAVWPGQGAYYAALMVSAYIAYHALLGPAGGATAGVWTRIGSLLQHEASVFGFGTALAAAGLLPRVEFNALSNLAGGYMGENLGVGGLQPSQWIRLALPSAWYVGLSVLVLAAAAPIVARRLGRSAWFFGITSIGALLLTGTVETPLHSLMYRLLPGFGNLHPHAPERILTVAYLGPALLAGATLSVANDHKDLWMRAASHSGIVLAGVATLVVALVTADLALGGARARAERLLIDPLDGIERLTPVDLATYYQPTGASVFLAQRTAELPGRFFGFAPNVNGHVLAYTFRFVDPSTRALLVNNHALSLGLQDVQGYDASHLRRYDDFLAALNGQTQNYHDASIFSTGLSSPLLNLLNARYIVVPVHVDSLGAPALERFSTTIYEDGQVRILENPNALPRAWIVHAAAQVAPGGSDGMLPIAAGRVHAQRAALLEEPPPPLETPADPSLDRADALTDEANRLAVRTSTDAAGLLVLSEIYYPAWKAYVDDRPAHVYVADGALRGVAVPVGEHTVELRFESDTLSLGMLISSAAVLVLLLLEVALLARRHA